MSPRTELRLTMTPRWRLSIPLNAARLHRNVPMRFVSTTAWKSSSVWSTSAASRWIAAFLTSRSHKKPSASMAASTAGFIRDGDDPRLTTLPDRVRDRGGPLPVDVENDDPRPVGDRSPYDRRADAPCTACHDRTASRQPARVHPAPARAPATAAAVVCRCAGIGAAASASLDARHPGRSR